MFLSSYAKTETEETPRKDLENVTVRFKLNEFETIAQVYPATIEQTLEEIALKFQLLPRYLSIKPVKNGPRFPKSAQLKELCDNEFGIIDVQLGLSDLAHHINDSIHNDFEEDRLNTDLYFRHYRLPDFISVTVPDKENPSCYKRVVVEIVNDPIVKPFLGGYVNKSTGIEYHNAYSQTGPLKEQIKYEGLATRDTQTTPRHEEKVDERPLSNLVDNENDEVKNQMATVIQRNFRWHRWKKLIKQSSLEWKQQMSEQNPSFSEPDVEATSPKTPKDFERLILRVRQWKEKEFENIRENVNDKAERQIQFNSLLKREITLLNAIENKRNHMNKQHQAKRMENLLNKLGEPIKWIGYKNIECQMDTLECQKIRKLTAFYQQLKIATDKFDRIEFIRELCRILVEEQQTNVLEELVALLRREENMLVVNVDKDTLKSLRCRQIEVFRDFITSLKTFTGK